MTRTMGIVLSLAVATVTAGCEDDKGSAAPEPSLVEVAAATPELSTLVAALQAGELDGTLGMEGPFTVFAPVNSAFGQLSEAQLDVLLAPENRALLQKVLTYHVVAGEVYAAELTDGAEVTTVEGSTLRIDLSGEPMVNGARIIGTDIVASNGVVHLINGVLTENLDIVDVATLNGFTTLLTAASAAGLVDALRGNGSGDGLTVFAPTEAAFAALGEVPSDPAVLEQVLLYHVVGGRTPSSALTDGQTISTLQGGTVTANLSSGVTIDGASNSADVISADVHASNGIIHVIDAVLLPPSS